MACTTILVGKKASYDGSCIIARNDDSGAGNYTPKKYVIINPKDQPRKYTTCISHLTIDLEDNPLTYSATPNVNREHGIWCAAGVNSLNVAMSATETITSNPRVLGADPLVNYIKGDGKKKDIPGGIGEEDIVHIILPYIKSAREGVIRLGSMLEKYGTYEMNGVAFADEKEIWWLETVGGHHFLAKRVEDDEYVVMPNQFGMDEYDLDDGVGKQVKHICSKDMKEFIKDNHLDLSNDDYFNPRLAFGSHDDSDHIYNTPRAWYMLKYFNPTFCDWESDYRPEDDDLPFSMVPERKITIEDVKYILSSHFQGTPYDPYLSYGDKSLAGKYRSIGVNRTDDLEIIQLRPYGNKMTRPIEWQAFGSNVFNVCIPQYTCVDKSPSYLNCTTENVDTNSFYWVSRLIGAMADASYKDSLNTIERYQLAGASLGNKLINEYDKQFSKLKKKEDISKLAIKANQNICDGFEKLSKDALNKVLKSCSNKMKNAFSRSDA